MDDIEVVSVNGMFRSTSPYSSAIKVGKLVFVSGCVPIDRATGATVVGGIREQTVAVLANVAAILGAAGTDLSRVVKTTVFLTDFTEFAEMNDAYRSAFGETLPARSTVEISRLAKPDYHIEIEAIAVVP